MDWVQWLVPLVALGVWILSNLARNREDEPRRARPPQVRGDGMPEAAPRQRKEPEEVDRFLDEVRRRRENTERKKKADEPRRVLLPKREETRKPAQPQSRQDAQRKPTPPPVPKLIPVKEPPTSPRKEPGSSPRSANRIEEVVVARIVSPTPRSDSPAPVHAERTIPQLLDLLCRKENLTTAVLLREVLGPPLCKRPFGVPPAERKE